MISPMLPGNHPGPIAAHAEVRHGHSIGKESKVPFQHARRHTNHHAPWTAEACPLFHLMFPSQCRLHAHAGPLTSARVQVSNAHEHSYTLQTHACVQTQAHTHGGRKGRFVPQAKPVVLKIFFVYRQGTKTGQAATSLEPAIRS